MMTHRMRCLTLAIGALLSAFAVLSVAAAPQRTFVASNGSDSAPCSLTLPCRGFAAAVAAVAPSGEVVVLDSAGYGAFTITKSVSVIAPTGIYAGISVFSGTDGVVVNAPGGTVALRGLVINGQGGNRGIVVTSAASVSIDNCTISGVGGVGIEIDGSAGVRVADSIVRDVGGAGFVANNGQVQLNRVQVRQVGDIGIYLTNGTMSIRDSVVVETALEGVYAYAAGGNTSTLTIERTTIAQTSYEGLLVLTEGGQATVMAIDNVLTDGVNWPAVTALGNGAIVRASGNTVTRFPTCGFQAQLGSTFESPGDNFLQGNSGAPTCGPITSVGKY